MTLLTTKESIEQWDEIGLYIKGELEWVNLAVQADQWEAAQNRTLALAKYIGVVKIWVETNTPATVRSRMRQTLNVAYRESVAILQIIHSRRKSVAKHDRITAEIVSESIPVKTYTTKTLIMSTLTLIFLLIASVSWLYLLGAALWRLFT